MRKTPTIFERDRTRKGHPILADVYAVDPVLLGRAVSTVKFDGVAVELDDTHFWWVRAECKQSVRSRITGWPPGFRFVEHDPTTGKDVGWVPLDGDSWVHDAICNTPTAIEPGTYEAMRPTDLCPYPHLIRHGSRRLYGVPIDFDGLRAYLAERPEIEGIVWHLDGEPIGKVKQYDLGLPWPTRSSLGETDRPGGYRSPVSAGSTLPPVVDAGSPSEVDA